MWKILVVALLGLECCFGLDINCKTFQAIDTAVTTSGEGQKYFNIEVHSEHWTPGKAINVTLHSKVVDSLRMKFKSFILQAQTVTDEPIGTWEILNTTFHKKHTCNADSDTLINKDQIQEVTEVLAKWHPPTNKNIDIPLGEVDFNAAVIGDHQHKTFTWKNIRSEVIQKQDVHDVDAEMTEHEVDKSNQEKEATGTKEETRTGTGENPGEPEQIDEQQRQRSAQLDQEGGDAADRRDSYNEETEAMLKAKEKLQKEIDAEDEESEGPWVAEEARKEDEEKEEYEKEMLLYEKEQAEEDERRQKIMLLEIKDKEEHDKLMAEMSTTKKTWDNDQNDVNDDIEEIDDLGKVNGVSRAAISVTTLLIAFVIALF